MSEITLIEPTTQDEYGLATSWSSSNPATFTDKPFTHFDLEEEDQPNKFPLDSLNASQRKAVIEVAQANQQDEALAAMVSLGGLGGSVGRAYRVSGASTRDTYPNLSVVVSADRSYGKGASSEILRPIIERNDEIQRNYRERLVPELKAKRDVAEKKRKSELNDPNPNIAKIQSLQAEVDQFVEELNQPPALIVGCATGAALSEALKRNNEQLFSYSPEAGDMVRVAMGRYASDNRGDFDLFLSAYSVEQFSESRVGRGVKHLSKPCLSVVWLVQPRLLWELLGNDEAVERGFVARPLYGVIPSMEIPIDDGSILSINRETMRGWEAILKRCLDRRNNETSIVHCEDKGRAIFRDFHNETVKWRNNEFREIQGEMGRARENAIRLALGQCIADALEKNEEPKILTPNHAERGVAIARYSYRNLVKLLSPLKEEVSAKRAEKLEREVQNKGGRATLNDLRRRNGFEHEEVQRLAKKYPNRFRVLASEVSPNGGRPSEIVEVLPPPAS